MHAVAEEFEQSVDDVVSVEKPVSFHSFVQIYRNWYDISDKEVVNLLKKKNKKK